MKYYGIYAILAILLASGCAGPAVDKQAEGEKLMQLSREWSEAAASGDMEATLSYWADDAVLMAPGQPPIKGIEAIREYVKVSGQIPGFEISWEPISAHISNGGNYGLHD